MINHTPSISPNLLAASLEFVTMDDVKCIVERRLRWYGLEQIAVDGIDHRADGTITVTMADRRRNETYRHVFETSLTVAVGEEQSKQSLAA